MIVDQEGGLGSDEAGLFLERHDVQRRAKATDMHASMVERHHQLVRNLLNLIQDQCAEEGIPASKEDILAEVCYAKNNMLQVGCIIAF